ncbi:NUDIX hydrolase [Actinomadura craniellae]|uniref:NUDIX hydrolase n=1 Tax=Actinomadura craniellae TaxID=2231787 RepID=A0A365HB10_9ACTN|nr:NUDIX domain-containing protein [Actinomadura craniellae]RAY16334.1 NUDIX hydrolase [Actinomadura craniellae]
MSTLDRAHAVLRVTADLVILTVRKGAMHVLVIERGNEPFHGMLALPGGFLRADETLEEAAGRELAEETGLDGGRLYLEQLRSYSDMERDPRGRVVTVAYLALAPDLPIPTAGTDARAARWEPVEKIMAAGLAFDHGRILADAIERARAKLEYTTLATAFCGDSFTVSELQDVYEAVWGVSLDRRNFNRKVTHAAGFIEPTGQKRQSAAGRPAVLYRRGPAATLSPPMLRATIDRNVD